MSIYCKTGKIIKFADQKNILQTFGQRSFRAFQKRNFSIDSRIFHACEYYHYAEISCTQIACASNLRFFHVTKNSCFTVNGKSAATSGRLGIQERNQNQRTFVSVLIMRSMRITGESPAFTIAGTYWARIGICPLINPFLDLSRLKFKWTYPSRSIKSGQSINTSNVLTLSSDPHLQGQLQGITIIQITQHYLRFLGGSDIRQNYLHPYQTAAGLYTDL